MATYLATCEDVYSNTNELYITCNKYLELHVATGTLFMTG